MDVASSLAPSHPREPEVVADVRLVPGNHPTSPVTDFVSDSSGTEN